MAAIFPKLLRVRVAVLVAFTYLYFFQGSDPNQTTRISLTRAIAERGQPDITPWHAHTVDKGFRAGRFYSDKAPFVSLAAVVPWTVMMALDEPSGLDPSSRPVQQTKLHLATFLLSGVCGALAAWLVQRTLVLLGAGRRLAEGLAVVYALGTLVFPFATVLFGHVTAAAAIAAALYLSVRWRLSDGQPTPRRAFVLGALFAVAFVTEYPTALLSMVLAVSFVTWTRPTWRSLAGLAGGGLLGAAPLVLAHALFTRWAFGSFAVLPYSFLIEPIFVAHTTSGVLGIGVPSLARTYGVLLSRYRGVLYLCPVLTLTFAGLAAWWRGAGPRREAAVVSASLVAYLWFACSYYAWDGGGSAGPRHLVPVMAHFVVALSFYARSSAFASRLTVALAVVSVALMAAVTATLVELPEGSLERTNQLYSDVLPSLVRGDLAQNVQDAFYPRPQGDASHNLGVLVGLSPHASLGLLAAIWALAYAAPRLGRRALA